VLDCKLSSNFNVYHSLFSYNRLNIYTSKDLGVIKMKKIMLVFASILLMILVACGNDDQNSEQGIDQNSTSEEEQTTENNDSADDTEVDESDDEDNESEDTEEDNDDSDQESDEADDNKEHADFEEYSVVEEHIDLDKYDMDVEEDNSHKRIILYKDDNNKKDYKSIYLKDKNRLKIIEFDNGEIYNDVID